MSTVELKMRETKCAIAYALGLPTQWLVSFTVKVCATGPLEVTAEYYVRESDLRFSRVTFVGSPDAISNVMAALIVDSKAEHAA